MNAFEHWQKVYQTKKADEVSWYCPRLESSLALIDRAGVDCGEEVIDIGGGASTLVDDLVKRGYGRITVLDVSPAALEVPKARLGLRARGVAWLAADILDVDLGEARFGLWHDRAVFHFLIQKHDREIYLAALRRAIKPGGQVVMGVFGADGPMKCSGLDAMRYDAAALHTELGDSFALLESRIEVHTTPSGGRQQFQFCRFLAT